MFKKIYTLTGAIATAFYPGFAFSTCDYQTKTNLTYQKEIQSIKNFTKDVKDHTNNTRKCTVNMSIKVDGKWYDAEGSYIYGPNLSENEGCNKADERAKEDVLRLVAPEIVTGQKYLNCHTGKRVVDLVPNIVDNKICSKVFFDALVDDELIKIWGYDCNG
mgnify:FL=1